MSLIIDYKGFVPWHVLCKKHGGPGYLYSLPSMTQCIPCKKDKTFACRRLVKQMKFWQGPGPNIACIKVLHASLKSTVVTIARNAIMSHRDPRIQSWVRQHTSCTTIPPATVKRSIMNVSQVLKVHSFDSVKDKPMPWLLAARRGDDMSRIHKSSLIENPIAFESLQRSQNKFLKEWCIKTNVRMSACRTIPRSCTRSLSCILPSGTPHSQQFHDYVAEFQPHDSQVYAQEDKDKSVLWQQQAECYVARCMF